MNQVIPETSIAIDFTIEACENMIENLKTYKQCMIDCKNMQAKKINLETNFEVKTFTQSHTLPGILSIDQSINKNFEDVEKLNTDIENALRFKRIYFRLIDDESKVLFKFFNELRRNDISFEENLEIMNKNIDLNIQPHRMNNQQTRTKPSIKVQIDQKPYKDKK